MEYFTIYVKYPDEKEWFDMSFRFETLKETKEILKTISSKKVNKGKLYQIWKVTKEKVE